MGQLPKPFQRPGISLSTGEKREWREVPVETLSVGDLVQSKGLVAAVRESVDVVIVFWKNETQTTYTLGELVHAFVQL